MPENINNFKIPDSILLIDKSTGISSYDIIRRIKMTFKTDAPKAERPLAKIGHAGTLDPIASGLVIILINGGTKKSDSFLTLDKCYEATLFIGSATDSYDSTGKVLEAKELPAGYFDDPQNFSGLKLAIESFVGEIMQEPPMFSALKRNSVPLYKLARNGISVPREKRLCKIYSIKLTGERALYDEVLKGFNFSFRVSCSKGTYIRSLCYDIGVKLGIPCHMSGLRRVSVGEYNVSEALPVDEISKETVLNKLIKL
ncbi:MAG TPA: tRNA pseudouridine(55) synthase TruB [Candidatus Wallbacteria bacterium]|nr:tRNA pseudouridine(55) synthase TruB [Candidatus Wallbacteria bacterium]